MCLAYMPYKPRLTSECLRWSEYEAVGCDGMEVTGGCFTNRPRGQADLEEKGVSVSIKQRYFVFPLFASFRKQF